MALLADASTVHRRGALVAAALSGSLGALVARVQSGSHRTRGHCARAAVQGREGLKVVVQRAGAYL
jgi:hypothetical protein